MKQPAHQESTHVDPVCGMTVEPAKAAGSSEYGGETYYFCSVGCKEKFDADPPKYAGAKASAPAIDPVCGMTFDPAKAAGSSEYAGETYYFCSAGCKEKFDADPPKYAVLKSSAPAKDPVCGMTVDPAKAAGSSEYRGETYYFCSPGCKSKFEADPAKFTEHNQSTGDRHLTTTPAENSLTPDPSPAGRVAPSPGGKTMYVCPMDPEVRQDTPGACPKCGMALEPESVTASATKTEWTCPTARRVKARRVRRVFPRLVISSFTTWTTSSGSSTLRITRFISSR